MSQDPQPTQEQDEHDSSLRAPNPLWVVGIAILIILAFMIAIMWVVSPAFS